MGLPLSGDGHGDMPVGGEDLAPGLSLGLFLGEGVLSVDFGEVFLEPSGSKPKTAAMIGSDSPILEPVRGRLGPDPLLDRDRDSPFSFSGDMDRGWPFSSSTRGDGLGERGRPSRGELRGERRGELRGDLRGEFFGDLRGDCLRGLGNL